MFCTNCNTEDKTLKLQNPICKSCGFDNSYVLGLIAEESDEETEDELRTPLTCAQRCIVLFAVVSAAHGADRKKIADWLKNEKLWNFVSAKEKIFFESPKPSKQELINASWRVEALSVLIWALKKIPSVSNLQELCDTEEINKACDFYLKSTKGFLDSSELRSEDEIHSLNELIYDSHWKVRDAQSNDRPVPNKIIPSVVQERHHAINWLMGYCGKEWDEVTTDT